MNEENEYKEKVVPSPKELEKEIGEFLAKKFGDSVKIVSPKVFPQEMLLENEEEEISTKAKKINFNLKPDDLIAYLDRYIIKQDNAKAILATKICTHFNRIKLFESNGDYINELVGGVKNNILMIGPTGVGKTYMVKLIAKKIGVPFVKGDATKFSETGYVGGDVEDLVRDLVREANGDIELAKYGIIYLDEIDKIAACRNLIGSDISRTGVQRALLKPMEETDVDLKVPNDPISMIQEIERFRKTGKRNKRTINTKNILFIMSGAFSDLTQIIKKRVADQVIGFGSHIESQQGLDNLLKFVKAEDLVEFGFESEFVGRLPVKAVFEKLNQDDLFQILKSPNNPIILGKKLDFSAYGIDVKFEDEVLYSFAKEAFNEKTGARGLVSVIEKALLPFEKRLPSTNISKFPIILSFIENPKVSLEKMLRKEANETNDLFVVLSQKEKVYIKEYINSNKSVFTEKFKLNLTPSRVDLISEFYSKNITDIDGAIKKIKPYYEETKKIELYFFNDNDINMVLEEDAIDFIVEQLISNSLTLEVIYKKILADFGDGLKLIREKTGKNRFFITKEALLSPESYLNNLIKNELKAIEITQ